jgi:hypothetical protein
MAKLSLKNREAKREALVKKFEAKRKELAAVINDSTRSMEERMDARAKLQALPRNSSPTRLRNRCAMTGRGARFASLAWRAARSARPPCEAISPAWSRPAGNARRSRK